MVAVSRFIDRYPPDRRSGLARMVERVASRDYVYVLIVLAALGRLEWFIWAAAIGANLFWAGVWLGAQGRPGR